MKAMLYNPPGRLEVGDVAPPSPGPGEVLIKVHNAGICGSDLHIVHLAQKTGPDYVMGHEFSGEVAALGAAVTGLKLGDRVSAMPVAGCGHCSLCQRGFDFVCLQRHSLGFGIAPNYRPGGYAEYVVCEASELFKLPANFDYRLGALAEPLAVGMHGVNRSRMRAGSNCIIMGGGPIGLTTLVWCKARGASHIVLSEIDPQRGELARELGADAVVNPREHKPAEVLRELSGGAAPDVVFDCVGARGTLGEAVRHAPLCGQVVVVGLCLVADEIRPSHAIFKDLEMQFVIGYTRDEFRQSVDALTAGRVQVKALITDLIALEQAPAMFETLKHPGTRTKVLIEFPD